MVLLQAGETLQAADLAVPEPAEEEILLKVEACGICRTDLHILDGELRNPKLPLVMGHQIVGTVVQPGAKVTRFQLGQRVGVPWLGKTCQVCSYCSGGQENLCEQARFTGYHIDGGFAEYAVADQQFAFPLAREYPAVQAAPLLCAGLIGYRSLRLSEDPARELKYLGLYGFGSAAHILIQVARFQGREVYAFTRSGDQRGQEFARRLGATWAGGSDQLPPQRLDAAIIFAPVGGLVPRALQAVRPGGTVVCGGIYMSDIPSFSYSYLWEERILRSVANLTRRDGEEFLELATKIPVRTEVTTYPLVQANEALQALREGRHEGSIVLEV
ncbi:MAG: zinc-dependent alcohol dehydrogenase family protein [Spirochaetaceae bacterium]|nr:MAG: zinc-dependent alcohol dehydrogenase family protein [Spirochaetaceae bacterium]